MPALRRSAFLTERRDLALAFPMEVRFFLPMAVVLETRFGLGDFPFFVSDRCIKIHWICFWHGRLKSHPHIISAEQVGGSGEEEQ